LSWLPVGRKELEDQDRLGAEWLRSKGVRSWDGKVERRLTKWLSTRASGEESLKPYVPPRHR